MKNKAVVFTLGRCEIIWRIRHDKNLPKPLFNKEGETKNWITQTHWVMTKKIDYHNTPHTFHTIRFQRITRRQGEGDEAYYYA